MTHERTGAEIAGHDTGTTVNENNETKQTTGHKKKVVKRAAAVLLAGGLTWGITTCKGITDANARKFKDNQAKELRDLKDKALPKFRKFTTNLQDETIPGKIVAEDPSYDRDEAGDPYLIEGTIRLSFGICSKLFDVAPDENGVYLIYSDDGYGRHDDSPFAIIQGSKIIGQKPPTKLGLVQTFPAECATTPEEVAALQVPKA